MNFRVACLLAVSVLALPSGCCCWKNFFGTTSYQLHIRADKDANRGGPTDVLVVWPSGDDKVMAALDQVKDIEEARAKLQSWTRGDQYEAVDLGYVYPGDQKELQEMEGRVKGGPLRSHCSATHVFVFTTLPKYEKISKPLTDVDGEFDEDLRIHVRNRAVKLSF